MIRKLAAEIAEEKGIQLTEIRLIEGRRVGCLDVFLLHLAASEQNVTTLLHQHELEGLEDGSPSGRLESKLHTALSRLQPRQDFLPHDNPEPA